MLNVLIITLVCYLSVVIGHFFRYVAEEEIKPGMKYFRWLLNVFILLIIGVFLFEFYQTLDLSNTNAYIFVQKDFLYQLVLCAAVL